ncbi:hypothetical protein R5R35_002289 [Gryllus longicercus]|uniref:Accessory gland protein n=1 Tax=Gryllus longicercus TaxID=2509291 RepID=A0AAN9VSM9_9ORTH
MATVALVAASTTLLMARGATADRLIARGAFADAPDWAGPDGGAPAATPDPQPPGSLFKVALTQKGYIQVCPRSHRCLPRERNNTRAGELLAGEITRFPQNVSHGESSSKT